MIEIRAHQRIYRIAELANETDNRGAIVVDVIAAARPPELPPDYVEGEWTAMTALATAIANQGHVDLYYVAICDESGNFIDAELLNKNGLKYKHNLDIDQPNGHRPLSVEERAELRRAIDYIRQMLEDQDATDGR